MLDGFAAVVVVPIYLLFVLLCSNFSGGIVILFLCYAKFLFHSHQHRHHRTDFVGLANECGSMHWICAFYKLMPFIRNRISVVFIIMNVHLLDRHVHCTATTYKHILYTKLANKH